MKKFSEIQFGFSSAETESARAPNLLINGYWDLGGVVQEAKSGYKFLYLGYKGSGKSSLAEHLKLSNSYTFFPTLMNLVDFPYTSFKKIVTGDFDPEGKFPTAWSWLILLKILTSFEKDEGASGRNDSTYQELIKSLKKLGIFESDSLNKLVTTSSKHTFKAQIPALLGVGIETGVEKTFNSTEIAFQDFVEKIQNAVITFKTKSSHLIIIDGLDDVLSSKETQYVSLAALVLQVNKLNNLFTSCQTPAKIILLCRTELFEKLPSANKNKIRQDSSILLEWYDEQNDSKHNNLWSLLNLRSKLSLDNSFSDLITDYFPVKVSDKETKEFLLSFTRFTPRDLVSLMVNIQGKSKNLKVSEAEIIQATKTYSINYFIPEIKDELSGYFSHDDIELIFKIIAQLQKREFTFIDIKNAFDLNDNVLKSSLESLLTAMFECGAVGNVHQLSNGNSFFTFKYKNRNSNLKINQKIILHRGFWKAMNIF